jgi:hypothetical protein
MIMNAVDKFFVLVAVVPAIVIGVVYFFKRKVPAANKAQRRDAQ